jgi:hypothetical protein
LWEVKLAPTNMIQKVSIYFTSDTPFPAIFWTECISFWPSRAPKDFTWAKYNPPFLSDRNNICIHGQQRVYCPHVQDCRTDWYQYCWTGRTFCRRGSRLPLQCTPHPVPKYASASTICSLILRFYSDIKPTNNLLLNSHENVFVNFGLDWQLMDEASVAFKYLLCCSE